MTARAWERGQDHDGLLDSQIEEGQASLDAWQNQNPPAEDRALETPEEIAIDAARCGIKLLVHVIESIKEGKTPTCTIQEIGQALVGTPAPHPNWYEKVCLAKRQDEILRSTRRILVMTRDALVEEDEPNVSLYVEDMLSELDDYKPAPEL